MMLVKRFYEPRLAQASYLIASTEAGIGIVIDPHRDSDCYLRAAAEEGVTITHVTETHIHADFVSGTWELAARTGAAVYLSDEGGAEWRYAVADGANVLRLKDGDTIDVAGVHLQALHTPGHTPEHLTFLVTDTKTAETPVAAVTGDFVFVGDVGRPDLLERAGGVADSMEAAARTLFGSLQRWRPYPDYLQLWPGHGAGSPCGKGIGALPQSTLGYERRFNWAFGMTDAAAFVHHVLDGQPEVPPYFAEMKRLNREGPRLLGGVPSPPRVSATRLDGAIAAGALVIDTRPASDYAAAHVPGTLNIPLNRGFTTWAGWLVPSTQEVYLIIEDRDAAGVTDAVRALAMIGLERVRGYVGTDAIRAWKTAGRAIGRIIPIDGASLVAQVRTGTVTVVDVRSAAEWETGHIPGAQNIPLGYLPDRLTSLPTDRPIVVHCQEGPRSAIAASLLSARSPLRVINFSDGFHAWQAAGYPVESHPHASLDPEAGRGPTGDRSTTR
jgi:hydroxyacylglutathione hydrolase